LDKLASHGEVKDRRPGREYLVDGLWSETARVDPVSQALGGGDVDPVDALMSQNRDHVLVEMDPPVEDGAGGVSPFSGEPVLADLREAGELSRVDEAAALALSLGVALESRGGSLAVESLLDSSGPLSLDVPDANVDFVSTARSLADHRRPPFRAGFSR